MDAHVVKDWTRKKSVSLCPFVPMTWAIAGTTVAKPLKRRKGGTKTLALLRRDNRRDRDSPTLSLPQFPPPGGFRGQKGQPPPSIETKFATSNSAPIRARVAATSCLSRHWSSTPSWQVAPHRALGPQRSEHRQWCRPTRAKRSTRCCRFRIGTTGHVWLHRRCWTAWHAIAALAAIGFEEGIICR